MAYSKVTVQLIPFNDGTPNHAQTTQLGEITIVEAHHLLNTLAEMPRTRETCVSYAHTSFTDGIIRDKYKPLRISDLTAYIEYRSECLCGATNVTECARSMRAGKCRCKLMNNLAQAVYPKKYPNHR